MWGISQVFSGCCVRLTGASTGSLLEVDGQGCPSSALTSPARYWIVETKARMTIASWSSWFQVGVNNLLLLSGAGTIFPTILVLFLGNPGNEGFYADFGRRVVKSLLSREERMGDRKRHYLFYTVSHLNHVILPNELKNTGNHRHCGEWPRAIADIKHRSLFL